ncbi:MAG: alpha-1,2-fucosyltransferase [Minisyncoccota bacterium]
MRKIVILRATGGELSNQLWNYTSVYAYCLERGYSIQNPSFFEYGNYFTMRAPNLFFRLFFFLPFTDYTERKQSFKRRLWRKLYEYYAQTLIFLHTDSVIVSDNRSNRPFYLPPTSEIPGVSILEKSAGVIYLDGWLFRNPAGLQKYRKEILEYFKPRYDIVQEVRTRMQKLRGEFKHVIGVHIRQGDYQVWRGGAYFIPQARVREILDEYLKIASYAASETCFVITSDGPVETSLFTGLNIWVSKGSGAHDVFLLSSADAVIGSNSTFGAFASYYGNIPFIVMQKEGVNWKYYADKWKYFENKYCTMVHF